MNRSTEIRLDEPKTKKIQLGFVGENLYRQVWFMCDEIYAQFPHAAAALTVMPPKGQSYPAVLERVDNAVVWNITDSDLAYRGRGEIQLSFVVDEMVAKTYVGRFEIERSLSPQGEAPTGIDDFLTRAGAALTAIPETIDAALEEAKESGEFDGPPGPPGEDGKDGRDGVDGKDGKDGQDGAPGQDGKDGKDGQDGRDGRDGTNGTNGTDGADAYVWIRYAAAQPTADADMKTSPDAWIGIYSGDAATAPEHYTDYAWYKIKGEPGAVQDVQVAGTSVLEDGIAKIPRATSDTTGVILLGDGFSTDNQTHKTKVDYANADNCKAGSSQKKAIAPYQQHRSVFYGLSKLAGADLANETVTVGQYPTAALTAIQKMLGIYEAPWELIREDEFTNATEGNYTINVDNYGEPFELTDVRGVIWIPTQNNEAKVANGIVYAYSGETKIKEMAVDLKTAAANSNPCGAYFMLEQKDGMMFHQTNGWHNQSVMGNVRMTLRYDNTSGSTYPFELMSETGITSIQLKKYTGRFQYRLYGRRKWRT